MINDVSKSSNALSLHGDVYTSTHASRLFYQNGLFSVDLKSNGSDNSISYRHSSNGTTFSSILTLTNDVKSNSSTAGQFNGRVAASQFVLNQVDTRTPTSKALYMSQDGNKAAFGSQGGFTFVSYDQFGLCKLFSPRSDQYCLFELASLP
jgi:hypothetical protein